jgi:transposase
MANSRMLAMAAAIALRSDFTGADLRRLARRTQDAKQARRLLSLATIYDGGSRSDTARIGDVGLQIIRDWVLRFNAAGPDGLVDRKAPGPEPRLNEDHCAALAAAIESGPIPAIHSVVCRRLVRWSSNTRIPTAGNWLRPDRLRIASVSASTDTPRW